jgi:hypothetical protein
MILTTYVWISVVLTPERGSYFDFYKKNNGLMTSLEIGFDIQKNI